MTVWTLEAGTNYEGHEVVGAYASAADALAIVAESDRMRAAEEWAAGWLSGCDSIRLTKVPVGVAAEVHEHLFAFDRRKDEKAWRECNEPWRGMFPAAELLALVTS